MVCTLISAHMYSEDDPADPHDVFPGHGLSECRPGLQLGIGSQEGVTTCMLHIFTALITSPLQRHQTLTYSAFA